MTAAVVHLARPHRPVLVAGTLAELTGPTDGIVELPLRLWWGPQHAFDLGQPTMLAWMYENVLRESIRIDELRRYLDGATLLRVWPELNLPRAVRAAWEARHPRLRLAAAREAADRLAAAGHESTGHGGADRLAAAGHESTGHGGAGRLAAAGHEVAAHQAAGHGGTGRLAAGAAAGSRPLAARSA